MQSQQDTHHFNSVVAAINEVTIKDVLQMLIYTVNKRWVSENWAIDVTVDVVLVAFSNDNRLSLFL